MFTCFVAGVAMMISSDCKTFELRVCTRGPQDLLLNRDRQGLARGNGRSTANCQNNLFVVGSVQFLCDPFPLILNTPNNKYPIHKKAYILGLCFFIRGLGLFSIQLGGRDFNCIMRTSETTTIMAWRSICISFGDLVSWPRMEA